MADTDTKVPGTEPGGEEAPSPATDAATMAPAAAGSEAAAPPDPTEALAKEAADLKDRLLRTLAEMENLRRRTDREVAETRQYAVANFARDLLGVADNMERALKTLSADFRDQADPVIKSHIEGVELTERELHKVMEK